VIGIGLQMDESLCLLTLKGKLKILEIARIIILFSVSVEYHLRLHYYLHIIRITVCFL